MAENWTPLSTNWHAVGIYLLMYLEWETRWLLTESIFIVPHMLVILLRTTKKFNQMLFRQEGFCNPFSLFYPSSCVHESSKLNRPEKRLIFTRDTLYVDGYVVWALNELFVSSVIATIVDLRFHNQPKLSTFSPVIINCDRGLHIIYACQLSTCVRKWMNDAPWRLTLFFWVQTNYII